MKSIKKIISAVMAAAVIFGTAEFSGMAAIPASADKLKVTDGVMCKYDDDSNLIGKFSGWAKTNGISRRYTDGKPHTGWLKSKDGSYRYVLDGYTVKGEIPIKNKVYTFDENGIMTEQKKADMTVRRDETAGTEPLVFEITPMHIGDFGYGNPDKLERWENGEWVDCLGVDGYIITDEENLISFQGCIQEVHIIEFSPKRYIGKEITAGTYRLTFHALEERPDKHNFELYCIFEIT